MMCPSRTRPLFCAHIVTCATLLIASCTSPSGQPDSGNLQQLVVALEEQGFIVQASELTKFGLVPVCYAGLTPTCMAINAGSPYMTFSLPNSPDQTSDTSFPWGFQLGENEAVILVGRTPPPVAYFSYQPFRTIIYSEKDETRKIIFEPLGDSINNLTISTDSTDPEPFNSSVIIIMTPDQEADARVRSAAHSAGYPQGVLNTIVIPSAVTHLGFDPQADEFAFAHRITLPNPGQEEAFLDYLNTNQTVLRVTLEDTSSLNPFPVPELRVRGTGKTEMDLLPVMGDLREAIIKRYAGLQREELTTSVWLTDGFDGTQREINQYGPIRDALYLRTDPFVTLTDDPDDFMIVYGVNHEAAGKATYSSLTTYVDPDLLLGMATANSREYAGSATAHLPGQAEADLMYVWKVARDCHDDAHCLEVRADDRERVDLAQPPELWAGFRLYLGQETMVGPASAQVVYDQVIHFNPRP